MSSLKKRSIINSMTKKGFKENTSGDHIYLAFVVDGKKTGIKTKVSHSHSEIGDSLIGLMAKEIKISKRDFMDFINCTLSEQDYRNKVQNYI